MMGYTHLVGGVASLWILVPFIEAGILPPDSMGAILIGALLGSLWPDLDARDSRLKRFPVYVERRRFHPFALTSEILNRTLGHRGLLHSLLGLFVSVIAPGIPLALLFGTIYVIGFLVGFMSHLMLDACTKSGIPLFYPAAHRWYALPTSLRISTGSPQEEAVFALLTGFGLTLLAHFWHDGPFASV